MTGKRYSNIIGFDDAPFDRNSREPVKIVGAVFADIRFDGVLIGDITRDGEDAAVQIAKITAASKFAEHAQLIMLQGITLGGFNVVDPFYLNDQLGLPILVVARKSPDLAAIRQALLTHIPGGHRKWAIMKKLGPMEPMGSVYVQRVGLGEQQARDVMARFSIHSQIPEPLRTAHLIAGALIKGQSRGNP
jgi:uncharacterized protein